MRSTKTILNHLEELKSNGKQKIYKSLKLLKIHRSTFYNNLKEEQKRILLETKILQKK